MARKVGVLVFLVSAVLGAACAGRTGGAAHATCPGSGWCGPAAEAERMAEEAAGATLTCPIHIEAAYAQKDGGALPSGVSAGAHGSLDEKHTKRARGDGGAVCCYTWVEPCPAG